MPRPQALGSSLPRRGVVSPLLCRSFLTARQALEQTLEKGVEQAAAEAGKPKAAQGQLPPAAPVARAASP